MTAHDRTHQQQLEHPEEARREEPVKGTGVWTAEMAADTTRRSALQRPVRKSLLTKLFRSSISYSTMLSEMRFGGGCWVTSTTSS